MPALPLVDVWTEKTAVVGPMLVSDDEQARLVVVRLSNDLMATDNIRALQLVGEVVERHWQRAPAGLELGVTGSAAIAGDMLSAAAESLRNTHSTTVMLVALALVVIYRSPLRILIPLATIGVATWVSLNCLTLLANWSFGVGDSLRVFTTTRIFVVVLMFGAGTDFCLFLIARYQEELRIVDQRERALLRALVRVGNALNASALTTVVGLAMMVVADYGKFASSGPSLAICLMITLLACLTFAPAALGILGGSLFWPRSGPPPAGSAQLSTRLWKRIANEVVDRPGRLVMASAILGLPLAWAGAKVEVTYDLLSELGPDRTSVRGTALLRQHYAAGEIAPLVVVARLPGARLDSVDGRLTIAHLSKPLEEMPGVRRVRSFYQPTGAPAGSTRLFTLDGAMELATQGSPLKKAAFVSQAGELAGEVTRLQVVLAVDPFSEAALEACNRIEEQLARLRDDPQSPWRGAHFEMYGTSLGIRDLRDVTSSDRRRIQLATVIAVFCVLLAILRRPLICCYLIVTVLASYFVALGMTRFVFMWSYGASYIGVDWKVPIFLFVILIAVGQDYNVYFVTRVFEEQRRWGVREGLRRAIYRTGGIISSCGIIMAGTFISMASGTLRGMIELGVALAIGILLDTFVVRTILVPAFFAATAKRASAAP